MKTSLRCLALLLVWSATARAQQATWIAPGNGLSAPQDWSNAANWDTGVVPNDPSAIAAIPIFTPGQLNSSGQPAGGANLLLTGDITVGEIRYLTSSALFTQAAPAFLVGDTVGPISNLRLTGAGFTLANPTGFLIAPRITVSAAALTFENQASAGSLTFGLSSGAIAYFRNSASAGQATISGHGNVAFSDSATAGTANIVGYHIVFGDTSSAGTATLAPIFDLATSSVEFRGHSFGGAATINLGKLGRVVFAEDSNAGEARVVIGNTAAERWVIIQDNAMTNDLTVTNQNAGSARLDIYGATRADVPVRSLEGNINVDLGANNLVFRTSGNNPSVTLQGLILGQGGLEWNRPSTLTVTNPGNNYFGVTRLLNGELRLADGRVSALDMAGGTRLTGEGVITGSLVNRGLVSPGSSAGTIYVLTNYTQAAGSALNIELLSPSNYDQLVVGGTASLGGTLNLSLAPGAGLVGSMNIDFLSASMRTGQFSTVNLTLPSVGAMLTSELVYTATGVRFAVTQKPFAAVGSGASAAALGAHLDATLATSSGDYRGMIAGLNTLNAAGVSAALDALAPDRYAALAENGHLAATAQQAARDRRLAAWRGESRRGLELFFEGGHRSATFAAIDALPEASSTLSHGTAGGAWRNGAFSLGASLSQETGELELDALGSRADLESLLAAVFFQYAPGAFFMNVSAGFSDDDYDLRRRIVYPGYDQTAAAAPAGRRTDLAVNAGYTLRSGPWTFAPQVGILNSRWKLGDLREAGAAGANLDITGWSARALRTRAGFEASRSGRGFSPRLAVFWLHETSEDRTFRAAFAGVTGAPYTVPGRLADRNVVQASLGFDWQLNRRAVFQLTAAGAWGDNTRLNSDLSAGLRWTF